MYLRYLCVSKLKRYREACGIREAGTAKLFE
jgi:hypothetical protein